MKMKVSALKTLPLLLLAMVIVCQVQEINAHLCGRSFFAAIIELIPCRAAVNPLSFIPPNEACCAAVKGLGQPCLCILVNGPPISGVDRELAKQLPQKCLTNFQPCEVAK